MHSLNDPSIRSDGPLNLIHRGINKLHTIWLQSTYPFKSCGRGLSIHYPCELSRQAAVWIRLGDSVMIRKDAWLNVVPGGDSESKIIVDDNSVIGARNMISSKNSIHIERDVILSASVLIQDHAHGFENVSLPIREQGVTAGGRIRIEQGCWIGYGAAILCNHGDLVIGRNTVIGANSVVTRSVSSYSVAVGNPARVIKRFDPIREEWVVGSELSELAESVR